MNLLKTAAFAVDFFSQSYLLWREGTGGMYVDGRWVPGAMEAHTIRATIFQPTAAELMKLPEGDREKAELSIWTRYPIIDGNAEDGARGDLVQVRGKWYRVMKLSDRSEGGFYKGLLERDADRGRTI